MNNPLINIERKYRIEIEGLRFVAALLVAIYHIWFNRVSGGVDVFFVISGFLITTSIISTINRTGEYRFWPYISKLLKRLLPSVFFVLGIVLTLSFFLLPGSIFNKTINEIIASMFYYQNWQLAISNTDYLDSDQMKTPVQHFWALSIQGQFYLIWFLIFTIILFFINRFKIQNIKKLINTILGILFSLSLIYSIYLTFENQQLAYFHTFTRVWEFALGGLICVNLSSIKLNRKFAILIGWLGLICLILTGIIFNVSEMFPGYIALWPMICALCIILSSEYESKYSIRLLLGAPILVKLGNISFGIYLWHWVLLEFYRYNIRGTPGFVVGTLIIIVSIILSFLMTRFIEKPIRSSKNINSFKRLGIMGGMNILLISGLLLTVNIELNKQQNLIVNNFPGALAVHVNNDISIQEPIPHLREAFDDLPLAHLDGSNQGLKNSDLKIGIYGQKEGYEFTVALVGSSVSEHWLGAILEATKSYNYRVLNITRSGTRFSTGYSEDDLKNTWNNNVLDYLKDSDVDLVISHATAANTNKDKIHQQMVDQLQYVKDEFDIEVLALRDVPRYSFSVLESLEMNGKDQTIIKMNQEENQMDERFWRDFEVENTSLFKLDLTEYFKIDGEFHQS